MCTVIYDLNDITHPNIITENRWFNIDDDNGRSDGDGSTISYFGHESQNTPKPDTNLIWVQVFKMKKVELEQSNLQNTASATCGTHTQTNFFSQNFLYVCQHIHTQAQRNNI